MLKLNYYDRKNADLKMNALFASPLLLQFSCAKVL